MCEEKILKYNISVQEYSGAKQVVLDRYCNGVVVKNAGTTLLVFGGDFLQPGESKSIGGNRAEILDVRIDLYFQVQVPAPAVITNLAFVTQKFYTNIDSCEKEVVK
jgi:hypothetical protein